MEEFTSKRTIEEVLDDETGELIPSINFFKQPEAIILKFRRIQEEAILGLGKPKFKCPFCFQILKISGKKTSRGSVSFFAHQYDSDECEIKTDGKYSKDEIETFKYNGIRESQRHIDLKNKIYNALTNSKSKLQGVKNVHLERRINSTNPILNWRRPDIYAEFQNKKIVFELQLSTTFLSVIVSRDIFYKLNNTFIIWVFNFSKNTQYVNLRNLMCKDIYYANKRNAFIFDKVAMEKSIVEKELYLLCIWFEPKIENGRIRHGLETKCMRYVKLSDLKFDSENYKPYYIDADSLFTKYEPELLIKRKEAEDRSKLWLENIERKIADKIELKKTKEEQLEIEKERKIQEVKNGIAEGSLSLTAKRKSGKWGFECEGIMIIEPIYNFIDKFSEEGLAQVRRDRRNGYVNLKGEEIIDCKYIKAFPFSGNYALVKYTSLWFKINSKGERVLSFPEGTKIEALNEYFLLYQKPMDWSSGRYGDYVNYYRLGLINYQGDLLTETKYSYHKIKEFENFENVQKEITAVLDSELIIAKLNLENEIEFVIIDKNSKENNSFNKLKKRKWGLISSDGNQIFECKYDSTFSKVEDFYKVKFDSLWGTLASDGNTIIPFKYERFFPRDNSIKVRENNLWGFIDYNGKDIIPCIYDAIWKFEDSKAQAKKNGLLGFIDKEGNQIIDFKYQEITFFTKELYLVKEKNLFGIIDLKGNKIFKSHYDIIETSRMFRYNGLDLYKVQKQGLWGFISLDSKERVPPIYESILSFSNYEAMAQREGLWGVINLNGEEIINCEFEVLEPFKNFRSKVKKNNLWGYIDKAGQEIIRCLYETIEPFENNKARVEKNSKWGYIDEDGKKLISCNYDTIEDFIDDKIKVKNNGKWGYIDENENVVIPCEYDTINDFTNNKAKVKKNNKWGYIDEDGKSVIPCEYETVGDFMTKGLKVKKNGKWGYLDKNGNILIPCEFDGIAYFTGNKAKVQKNSKWGYLDKNGNILIPCEFDDIAYFTSNKAKVQKNGKWGYLDRSGKVIVNIIYDELQDFYNGFTTIISENKKLKIRNLARCVKDKKRGYVDQTGKEYWQHWKDNRDFKRSNRRGFRRGNRRGYY